MHSLRAKAAGAAVVAVLAALLAAMALNFWLEMGEMEREAQDKQELSLRAAAALADASSERMQVRFAADGSVAEVRWTEEPDLSDHALIDSIGRSTGETATVFAFEAENGEFWRRSTNIIKPDGQRAVGTKLGSGGAVHAAILRGETFRGEAVILGKPYFTIYEPILDASGAVAGILYVGVEKSNVAAAALDLLGAQALTAALVLAAACAVVWFAAGKALGPLGPLASAAHRMGKGDYATPVEADERGDELGQLARSMETLRAALARGEEERAGLRAAEAAAKEQRDRTLRDLESNVNRVVDAAIAGDLSQRVEARFEEPQMASLAEAVNRLFDRVDAFLDDVQGMLDAMARRDLGQGMTGRWDGRFAAIADAAQTSLGALSDALGGAQSRAEDSRAAVGEVAEGLEALASRAESQAATLQETAATVEEISATSAASAEQLTTAETMTDGVAERAREGAESAGRAVEAVRRIEASSSKI
ncbi:MAG: Cache 3/Cache 2 fusion domain-containing protein, partial [Pseudomonadota bacterium]